MADQESTDTPTLSPSQRATRERVKREQIRHSAAAPVQAKIEQQFRESGLSL